MSGSGGCFVPIKSIRVGICQRGIGPICCGSCRFRGVSAGKTDIEEHRAAMGVDWDMDIKELSQSIPPAYTEYIGKALLGVSDGA